MFADVQIKRHVEDELGWEPRVNEAAVGVTVKDAVVTLNGQVRSYSEKTAVEQAVLRVRGVQAIASELEVELLGHHERTDEEIARAAADTLSWYAALPSGALQVKVSKGWLTLMGKVEWYFQCAMAVGAVSHLTGVKGLINDIEVAPSRRLTTHEVKAGIEAALMRSAEMEARRIRVEICGDTVLLSGTVETWPERAAAERAAWAAAGVCHVQNEIVVAKAIAAAND